MPYKEGKGYMKPDKDSLSQNGMESVFWGTQGDDTGYDIDTELIRMDGTAQRILAKAILTPAQAKVIYDLWLRDALMKGPLDPKEVGKVIALLNNAVGGIARNQFREVRMHERADAREEKRNGGAGAGSLFRRLFARGGQGGEQGQE